MRKRGRIGKGREEDKKEKKEMEKEKRMNTYNKHTQKINNKNRQVKYNCEG